MGDGDVDIVDAANLPVGMSGLPRKLIQRKGGRSKRGGHAICAIHH